MHLVRIKRNRTPTHPGAVLREDVFPAMGVSVTQAARKMGVSRQGLHKVLAEQRSITPEMAVRIGKYVGNGGGLWLRMQAAYDLWQAERLLAREVAAIPTQAAA